MLRSAAAGAAEIGGVLLGQTIHEAEGSSVVLDISDFTILPSTQDAAQEYRAPAEEVQRLREFSKFDRGAQAIGYFRTQNDPDFSLRPEEAAFVEEVLEEPCVVLLLHAPSGDRVLAGVIHSGGGSLRRTPMKLFQFDEAGLGAVQPIPVRPPSPAVTESLTPADFGRAQTRLLRVGAVALAALCAGAIAAYWWSGRFAFGSAESARGGSPRIQSDTSALQIVAPASSSGLDISVNRANGGVMIAWNSAGALQAVSGQLVITDGDAPSEIVPLGSHELQQGKVFYRSRSERLRFRVELADSMGRRYSDSVLVLGGSQTAAPSEGMAQRTVTAAATPAQPSQSGETPAPGTPQGGAVKTFQPPPEHPIRPAERVIALDTQTQIRVGTPTPLNIAQTAPPIQPPLATPPPSRSPAGTSPAQSAAAPEPEPPVSGPDKSSGTRQYIAPVALLQVTPRLDPVLRSVLVNDVEIEVKLQIDASGRVVKAQPVNTEAGLHQHMERAAVEAAMRWRFKAASIDGTAVPSVTVLKFVFRR